MKEKIKYDSGIRLKNFLQSEGIRQTELARNIQRSPQYVHQVCNGDTSIGKKFASALQELYGVSAAWLLTGEGQMKVKELPSGIDMLAEDNEEIKPEISKRKGRPYYNVDFALGFDLMANDQTDRFDYLVDFAPYNHCDCWCNVHGDSMHPTIASGDMVALKRIYDFRYLINGEIYAIVTNNGLRTIKRIRDNGDTFTLIPDNKTVAEQTIPKAIVTHVYHILGAVKHF